MSELEEWKAGLTPEEHQQYLRWVQLFDKWFLPQYSRTHMRVLDFLRDNSPSVLDVIYEYVAVDATPQKQTVERVVQALSQRGFVNTHSGGVSNSGRRVKKYSINLTRFPEAFNK